MRIKLILAIISAVLLVGAFPAMAVDIPVADGESIQAAIDVAVEGDRILVAAGTFNGALVIDGKTDLKLIGAGTDDSIISGVGVVGDLITITNSSDIQVKKFTVAGTAAATNDIYIDLSRNVLIKKCVIRGAVSAGIYYLRGVGLTITENTVTLNGGDGIYFDDYSWINVITLNTVTENGGTGIYHYYGNEDLIEGNTVSTNGGDGIYNEYGAPLHIKNNVVTGNSGYGIYEDAYGAYLNKVNKNTVTLNGSDGIYVYQGIKVKKNKVNENVGDGIYASSYGNIITENKVKTNTGDGIYCNDYNNWVEANVVDGNTGDGIYAYGTGSQILNNEVTNNGGDGIYNSEDLATISGNFVDTNGGDGIVPYYDSILVTDNISTNNGGYGIYTDDYSNTILRNKVKLNGSDGIGGYCWTCVIKDNNVRRNVGDGIVDVEHSKVAGNVVAKNAENGIDAQGYYGNWIKNNVTFENGDGITYFDLYDDADPTDDYWQGNTSDTSSPAGL